MWLLSYSMGIAVCTKYECLSVAFPGETSFCCEKTWVFTWHCSVMAKQSLRGSVLLPGCAAECPGAQMLLCLPATPGSALAPWGDRPCQRNKRGPFSGGRTWITGGTEALPIAQRQSAWPCIPKMCLWVSGITHSCLLEVEDVYHELNPTAAALAEQGAWEQLRRQVSASLKHQFSSLPPGGELVRMWGSSGIVWTKLQARIELFLAAWIWKRHVLLVITFCWIRQSVQWEENHFSGKDWWHMLELLWEGCLALEN